MNGDMALPLRTLLTSVAGDIAPRACAAGRDSNTQSVHSYKRQSSRKQICLTRNVQGARQARRMGERMSGESRAGAMFTSHAVTSEDALWPKPKKPLRQLSPGRRG